MHNTRDETRTPTGGSLTVRLRAPEPRGSNPADESGLHAEPHLGALDDPWPDRPYRAGYGWPVWIPPTSARAYISGAFALNLPTVPGEPKLGDWHDSGTWWSSVYLDGDGRPMDIPLWGPDGSGASAPGPPVLLDARPALAQVRHPAARRGTPVLAASVPQAIADMAWGSLHGTDLEPCRHDICRWTDATSEAQLEALAHAIEARISNGELRERWRCWRTAALHGPDDFHDAPVTTRPSAAPTDSIPVVFVLEPADE